MFSDEEKLVFPVVIGRDKDGKDVEIKADPLAFWSKLVKALDGDAQNAIDAIYPQRQGLDNEGKPEVGPDGKPLADPETPGEYLLRVEAMDRLFSAVRVAFGMLDYDPATGTGATVRHCQRAFNAYMRWVSGEKNGDEVSQGGSIATDGPPPVP